MKIALVEDSPQEAHQLSNMIRRYFKENKAGKDVVNHGYGMKSMRFVAEQYQGKMSVRAQNSIFTLHVLLPAGGGKGHE